jgi:hypothetical protein
MSFFSRPNLEDIQFRQISGTTLTLEGTTKIVNPNGLELYSGTGTTIAIAADRDLAFNPVLTHGMVMAYDSTVGRIRLMDISGGTGTNQYLGASPATISLGGITSGTELTGKTVSQILEELLVPATPATVVAPSLTLTTTPSSFAPIYEVGSSLDINANMSFSGGSVSPPYDSTGGTTGSAFRSGVATGYTYSGILFGTSQSIVENGYIVQLGGNSFTAAVQYASGQTVYNSGGAVQLSALPAGSLTTSRSFTGIYPWFWGSSSTAPTANQTLIDSGTKVVGNSSASIIVPNYNVVGEYIWFAVPESQPMKTAWQGGNNVSNNGTIPGDLFPAPTTVNITSPDSLWSGIDYRIYISDYPTSINYSMTFSN